MAQPPLSFSATRRDVLRGAGGLLIAFSWDRGARASSVDGSLPAASLNSFVRIGTDNRVTLICKFLEMGQGVHTGAATLLAEELDADWSQMQVETAPVDPRYTSVILGMQVTGGSASMAESWTELRRAGATARAMLVAAAAQQWRVPPSSLEVEAGTVRHRVSDRSATFGSLAEKAALQPVPETVTLKRPDQYRLIGKPTARIDTRAKSNGTAIYAGDMTLPDLKTALILRPPLFGATLKSVDASAAKAIPGVVDIVEVPSGVAVVATSFWVANKARNALVAQWDESKAEKRSSDQIMASYRALGGQPGAEVKRVGDLDAAMAGAAKRIASTSDLPYLAHAPMEPLVCVASLTADKCEVWAGTQLPELDRKNVARITGLKLEQVEIHTILAGGSFGRRTVLDSAYVAEAASILAARPALSPIRLMWTREDDITGGYYRPMFHHRIEGGLDRSGKLVAWHHRLVGQPLYRRPGIDFASVEGAEGVPYDVPRLIELHSTESPVPVLAWRAVGNTHTAFAIETAIDEFAHEAGRDPLDFRRELLKHDPLYLGVIDLAAAKSDWGTPMPAGRGRGFALHKLQGFADLKGPFGAYVAQVAEVTVSPDGDVRIDRVVCAINCGTAINPNIIRDQVEGSIAFGMGAALFSAITLDKGKVQESNFNAYRVMRLNEMPKIEVHIVPSTDPPRGVGEPAVPPAAPALANAIFAATGKRVRALPILPLLKA